MALPIRENLQVLSPLENACKAGKVFSISGPRAPHIDCIWICPEAIDKDLLLSSISSLASMTSTRTYVSGERPLTLHHLGGAVMPTLHGGSAVCPPLHGCCSSTSCSACSAFSLVPTSWRPHWFALTHTLYITCAHKLASMFRICGTCDQIVQLITFTHITVVKLNNLWGVE